MNEDKDTLINPDFISTIDSLNQMYFERVLGVRYVLQAVALAANTLFLVLMELGSWWQEQIYLSSVHSILSAYVCV